MAVDGEDDAAVVDEHIVDLRRSDRRAGWGRRDEVRDLAWFVRIPYVVGPDTGVEESTEHYVLRAPGAASRRILVHVVGAAAPAPMQEGLDAGYRQRGDADRIALVARVEQPDELRPVAAVVLDRLIGHHHQVAAT